MHCAHKLSEILWNTQSVSPNCALERKFTHRKDESFETLGMLHSCASRACRDAWAGWLNKMLERNSLIASSSELRHSIKALDQGAWLRRHRIRTFKGCKLHHQGWGSMYTPYCCAPQCGFLTVGSSLKEPRSEFGELFTQGSLPPTCRPVDGVWIQSCCDSLIWLKLFELPKTDDLTHLRHLKMTARWLLDHCLSSQGTKMNLTQ